MKTTKYVLPIKSVKDIEILEQQPYDELVPAQSIYDLFTATATLFPDRPGLTVLPSGRLDDPAHTRTNLEFLQEITRAANMLSELIETENGVVSILSPTYDQVPAAIWGAQTAAVVSCINYLLSPDVIVDLLRAENAEVLVVPGPTIDSVVWERAQAVIAKADWIRKVLVIGGAPGNDKRMLDFDSTVRDYPGDRLIFSRKIERDTLAALFHTGGTTGTPKLALQTHGNEIHGAWSFAQLWGIDETDVVLNSLPMFHVGGTISLGLSGMGAGAHMVVMSPHGFRNKEIVSNYWQFVERYSATIIGGVPTGLVALSEVPMGGANTSSVRMTFTGGSICPTTVSERIEAKVGVPVYEEYGMTETAAFISSNPFHGDRVLGSVGFRAPFSDIMIARQGGDKSSLEKCDTGEIGSVLLRGPQVFPGYKDSRHDVGALTEDGWLISGDLGYLNSEGRLFLTGREKDLIIRSGHNIDPAIIEETANAHPSISISAAVGMPDDYAGEVPVLFVVRAPGEDLDLVNFQKYMVEHIAEPPAKPRKVFELKELPTTTVGKIFKPRLRELAVQEKIRLEIENITGQGTVANITTTPRKDGTTDAAVSIRSVKEGKDRQELEAAINKAIVDLPIKLQLKWT